MWASNHHLNLSVVSGHQQSLECPGGPAQNHHFSSGSRYVRATFSQAGPEGLDPSPEYLNTPP